MTDPKPAKGDAPGAPEASMLFEEGEPIFARRTTVRDSSDRYANDTVRPDRNAGATARKIGGAVKSVAKVARPIAK